MFGEGLPHAAVETDAHGNILAVHDVGDEFGQLLRILMQTNPGMEMDVDHRKLCPLKLVLGHHEHRFGAELVER